MTDIISKAHRSWNMSRIQSKDTAPEIAVRTALHRRGYRFRLHVGSLPGKPDIVLPKWNTVIFVNGCFWHRHERCRYAYTPKTRVEFWTRKFRENVNRDRKVRTQLLALGWRCVVVWSCSVNGPPSKWPWLRGLLTKRRSMQHRLTGRQ